LGSALSPTQTRVGLRRLALPPVLDEFTAAWELGQAPVLEDYLDRLDPADSHAVVELIYREFCLAEADGRAPDISSYLSRFPRYRESLERLLRLHSACSPSLLGRWLEPGVAEEGLPEAGDSIGPYLLRRELGRGSFARVFLAEQADLENRLVVVKLSTRPTREPWLLARARHAHIVEIVSHAMVDDGALQLICMPFWGGATLAAVLATRRRGDRARVSGRDLLADLDAVAAPEYPAVHPARPAREVLAGLSFSQALAWIIARLAEALSHAFSRGVAHGDVKPSNILLSADGNPMLLDFNLARDGTPTDPDAIWPKDPGGTLAYMAPERLRKLAALELAGDETDIVPSGLPSAGDFQPNPGLSPLSPDPDLADLSPHRGDIYALGMVLLEALTGRSPAAASLPVSGDPGSRRGRLRAAAAAYASVRERSASSLIRAFAIAGGHAVVPGLRAILERCLAPDPARRYARAWELAEDLDRWRSNRPLVYAQEPFWGQTVPRWLRCNRRMLTAAALSLLTVSLVTTAVVLRVSNLDLHRTVKASALHKLSRLWDDPEAGAFRFQRPRTRRLLVPDDHQAIETAVRALKAYEILGPGDLPNPGNWRRRDEVCRLSLADRENLELWIMEQAYRYCRALEHRPDSPEAWRRALAILDQVSGTLLIPAVAPLRRRLEGKLGAAAPPPPAGSLAQLAPVWLDEYLLGVVAECEPEMAASPPQLESVNEAAALDGQTRAAERALGHYDKLLAIRPDSFWGHYRAAVVSYGQGGLARAAAHLEQCLRRRPDNPVLRGQLAGCLEALDQYHEALQQSDRALERAPDIAEFYRTRAFVRAKSGEIGKLPDDLRHFEMLSQTLPHTFWGIVRPGASLETSTQYVLEFPTALGGESRFIRGAHHDEIGEIPPDEINARARLAKAISDAEAPELATAELDKVLLLEPDHIAAREIRAEQAIKSQQFDAAQRDLDRVLNDPGLIEYLRENPQRFQPFYDNTTRLYLLNGKVEEARVIARRARDFALILKRHYGASQYYLARVYAVSGRSDPQFIKDAADQLFLAFVANPDYQKWYTQDSWFDAVRVQVNAELKQRPDPVEIHRRRTSHPLARAR
jgi:serine/threonine protein kinase